MSAPKLNKNLGVWLCFFALSACSHRRPSANYNVPQLKKDYIELQEFYGPEGSFPDILTKEQYPQHARIEELLLEATGLELGRALPLSKSDRQRLEKRGDYSALYVLHRLAPAELKKIFVARLQKKSLPINWAEKCEARFALINTYAKDFKKGELKKLLGPPERSKGHAFYYDCGDDNWPRTLKITEDHGHFNAQMVLRE